MSSSDAEKTGDGSLALRKREPVLYIKAFGNRKNLRRRITRAIASTGCYGGGEQDKREEAFLVEGEAGQQTHAQHT